MQGKKKFQRLTSPEGIAVYPRLNKPDTKFDANGVYSVDLDLDPSSKEVTAFIDSLKKMHEAAYKETCEAKGGKKLKKADLSIKTTDDGLLRIKFKLKAKGGTEERSWDQKPVLFDARGNPMVNPPNIGSGSRVKVAFEVVPFFTAMVGCGLSLRLRAVQVIDLREYTPGDNFDAYGFKATDGFEVTAPPTDATEESSEGDDF